ncbi:MAG: hypothetical protein AB7G93_16440 [Bdellovibrionales bacterium]
MKRRTLKEIRDPKTKFSSREVGVLNYLSDDDQHRHCRDHTPLAVTDLKDELVLSARVEGPPVVLGVSDMSKFSGALQIELICGSTAQLRLEVERVHGDGYQVRIFGQKIVGGGSVAMVGKNQDGDEST